MPEISREPHAIHAEVEVFFDGACPLCRREMGLLKWCDRGSRIRFTDINDAVFDGQALGKTHDELMARIYGRLNDGTWIDGVEVFRRLYAAVGFGPIVWLTRLPGISQLLDLGYAMFARNRLRLTGRCSGGTCRVHKGR